ncbi:hypothetical protein BCR36DRAFT_581891 [Piromyces finnis]|uniref:Uncharacterized protein n=1 Tax=Piromyces finnis TaxID=1754191 RepID=A0A1Y1VEL5_9FUNG|nr:hypothetical protein BCR36DRAFT_581891 [Piromyces finnis]|eukprot:ORX54267.1 hypothetical protein BCR36DRAFT_581891 [Piromyces finnis]
MRNRKQMILAKTEIYNTVMDKNGNKNKEILNNINEYNKNIYIQNNLKFEEVMIEKSHSEKESTQSKNVESRKSKTYLLNDDIFILNKNECNSKKNKSINTIVSFPKSNKYNYYNKKEKKKEKKNNNYEDKVNKMVKNEILCLLRQNISQYRYCNNAEQKLYQTMPGLEDDIHKYEKEQETIRVNKIKMNPKLPRISFCTPSMNTSKLPDYIRPTADPPHAIGKNYSYRQKQQRASQYVSKLYKNLNKKTKLNSANSHPFIDINISIARRKNNTKIEI